MSLVDLPLEVTLLILRDLNLRDTLSFCLSSKHFVCFIRDHRICKTMLELRAKHSRELCDARASGNYAGGLRRLIKTQDGISRAAPFVALKIAAAISFIYSDGVLCYTRSRSELRLLDLNQTTDYETVVDMRGWLSSNLDESIPMNKYTVVPIHFSHGVVSCVYSHAMNGVTSHWLLVIPLQNPGAIKPRPIPSRVGLFVRNDGQYLCYGTCTERTRDMFPAWAIGLLNLSTGTWVKPKLPQNLAGTDLNADVCFEIFDSKLYIVSSRTNFRIQESEVASYYYAARVSLDDWYLYKNDKGMWGQELGKIRSSWRRASIEGPIDDLWNVLKLERDETSGELMIVECRREWPFSSRESHRASYKTPLAFPDDDSTWHSLNSPSCSISEHQHEWQDHNDVYQYVAQMRNDEVARNRISSMRQPHNVHTVRDGDLTPFYPFSRCFVRSYIPRAESFVDMVLDTCEGDISKWTLHLRSQSRQPCVQHATACGVSPKGVHGSASPLEAKMADMYNNQVHIWPPTPSPQDSEEVLKKHANLHRILVPLDSMRTIKPMIDKRGLVYHAVPTTALTNGFLVFLGFDPSIRFRGLTNWHDGSLGPLNDGAVIPQPRTTAPNLVRNVPPMYRSLAEDPKQEPIGFDFSRAPKKRH